MNTTIRWLAAVALFAPAACSRPPSPAATAPQAAPDSALRRAQADSIATARAAAARRDSLARADSLARLARDRSRADSVRAEVARDSAEAGGGVVSSGLSAPEAEVIAMKIHFDFDKADIRSEDQQVLDRKLEVLRRYPRIEIQIAGNADERGSDEYNLALGERRASAAKRYLAAHGIGPDRITVISFGEERPEDPGHSEEAWSKNRRAEFVVTKGHS